MRASSLNTTAEGFRVHSLTAASLRWALGAICAIALLAGVTQSNGYAQLKLETPAAGEGGDGDPESSTDDPNKMPPEQAFRFMLKKIGDNESEINRLFSNMPLGFKEKQQRVLAAIEAYEKETEMLKANLDRAAFASFKAAPGADPLATRFVYRNLSEMLNPTQPDSIFDPESALEIIDVMMDNGAETDPVALAKGVRASFAVEDFDRAVMMLDRITEAAPDQDMSEPRDLLTETKEKWQRELMVRRLETTNDDLPIVKFETTAGDFSVVLYENHAPNTVANFINLVERKFYNDLTFHYVKPGDYVHGGSPNGDATGGPGYRIASEFDREQIRHFFNGTLGMANTGPDTEGSQFIITHQRMQELDGRFTAFGRVIEGLDVVRSMKAIDPLNPPEVLPGEENQIEGPVTIRRATVVRKRNHSYDVVKVTQPSDDGSGAVREANEDSIFGQSSTSDLPSVDAGLFEPAQR